MSNLPYSEYDDIDNQLTYLWFEEIGLSNRTANALYNNDIRTFNKLVSLSESDLLDLRGLGKLGYHEIREKLDSLSIKTIEKLVDMSEKESTNVSSTQHNINVDETMIDVPIVDIDFSTKTSNALINNKVYMLGDLTEFTYSDLRTLGGLDDSGIQEIELFLSNETYKNSIEIHEFLLSKVNKRQQAIFDRYYGLSNSYSKTTLETVAKEYGLTRERVRQINKAVLTKIAKAIKTKIINPTIELAIYEYINSPVQELPELSNIYHKYAVLKVYVDTKVFDIGLYKNNWLNSDWIVDDDFNIDYQLTKAVEALKSQIGPVSIEELANSYSVNEKILYDISNTTINDGLIVLNTNKRAAGNDLAFEIKDFMDRTVRPVTIQEVSDELNIGLNQVRGLIYRIPGVVNVGLSTYALEKYGYTGQSIIEIAEEFLEAEGQPIHLEKIISYVKKYKTVKDNSIPTQLNVYNNIFTKLDDGYYSLKKWGYTPTHSTINTRLDVPAKDAVLDIMSNSIDPMSPKEILNEVIKKYGNKSTSKPVTVSSVILSLLKDGIVTKLGTDRSPFYKINSIMLGSQEITDRTHVSTTHLQATENNNSSPIPDRVSFSLYNKTTIKSKIVSNKEVVEYIKSQNEKGESVKILYRLFDITKQPKWKIFEHYRLDGDFLYHIYNDQELQYRVSQVIDIDKERKKL